MAQQRQRKKTIRLRVDERKFIAAWLDNSMNISRAAQALGWPYMKAYQMFKRGIVEEHIGQIVADRMREYEAAAIDVLDHLRHCATSDFRDMLHVDDDGSQRLRLATELDAHAAAALADVTETVRTIPTKNGDPIVEINRKYRVHPKEPAARTFLTAMNMAGVNKHVHSGPGGQPIQYERGTSTPELADFLRHMHETAAAVGGKPLAEVVPGAN